MLDGTNSMKFKVGYLTDVGDMLLERQSIVKNDTKTDKEKLMVALFTDVD